MKTLLIAAAAAALFAGSAIAQDGGMRELGAHVHGEARLSVALDPDSGLALADLSGAAWNFYGFERAPESEAERETVAAVHAALSSDGLIAWPERAGCTLAQVTVSGAEPGADHDPDHGASDHGGGHEHDHGDHDHGEHDHGDHDHGDHDHGDQGHDHGESEHAHSDVAVSWTYQCERPEAAARFDAAGLFSALPRLERIDAEAFDGSRAAVRTLTPGDAAIRLE